MSPNEEDEEDVDDKNRGLLKKKVRVNLIKKDKKMKVSKKKGVMAKKGKKKK